MTDQSSAEIRCDRKDFISEHRDSYLQSGGTAGHIVDITPVGGHAFTTHCLIRYTGRKSGKTFITPLIYGDIGGEVVIVASKGGADHHPAWYLNILDSKEIDFQIATQAYRATWREPKGAEREKVWNFMVDVFPSYAKYQASTSRQIPLVMMKAIKPIEYSRRRMQRELASSEVRAEQSGAAMKIGVIYPQTELQGDPQAVRRIGLATEELGYDHLLVYDHVLGATHDREPKLSGPVHRQAAISRSLRHVRVSRGTDAAHRVGHRHSDPAPTSNCAGGTSGG